MPAGNSLVKCCNGGKKIVYDNYHGNHVIVGVVNYYLFYCFFTAQSAFLFNAHVT